MSLIFKIIFPKIFWRLEQKAEKNLHKIFLMILKQFRNSRMLRFDCFQAGVYFYKYQVYSFLNKQSNKIFPVSSEILRQENHKFNFSLWNLARLCHKIKNY